MHALAANTKRFDTSGLVMGLDYPVNWEQSGSRTSPRCRLLMEVASNESSRAADNPLAICKEMYYLLGLAAKLLRDTDIP